MKRFIECVKVAMGILLIFGLFACKGQGKNSDDEGVVDVAGKATAVVVDIGEGKNIEGVEISESVTTGKPITEKLPDKKVITYKGVFVEGRRIHLSKFGIAKTEVPYWLWYEVRLWAENNGYKFGNKGREGKGGKDGEAPTANKNQPVTNVTWRDAIVWCNALTQKVNNGDVSNCVYLKSEGGDVLMESKDEKAVTDADRTHFDQSRKGFRLPTAAEWEYAARLKEDGSLLPLNHLSGANADYTNKDACAKVAWYGENSKGTTYDVGTKEANSIGLFDMSGNVSELCFDQMVEKVDTTEVKDPISCDPSSSKVEYMVRGGSWLSRSDFCIAGWIYGVFPYHEYPAGHAYYDVMDDIGFRLAWYK